jgi:endoglucanase
LCGVNRSGLEYAQPIAGVDGAASFLDGVCLTEEEIATIARDWGARILRVPFTQDFVLRGRGDRSAADYRAAIDRVIAWAARHGCYTLLDLQWLDGDRVFGMNADFTWNRVPPLPDARSIETWSILAVRYRDEPAVLFDIFNEPHDPLPDDSYTLHGIVDDHDGADTIVPLSTRRVTMREWQPWARRLIAAIREPHPDAVVFVSGVRWAYDLRGMPLLGPDDTPLANIVYSTHVYPWSRTSRLRVGAYEQDWDRAFGHLADRVPVFVAEWGGTDEHVAWGRRLRRYLDARAIGWAAWSWADWPHLVQSHRTTDYTPTTFGALVRDALQHA